MGNKWNRKGCRNVKSLTPMTFWQSSHSDRIENKSQTEPRPPYLSGILFHPMSHPPEVTTRSFTSTPDTPATRSRRKKLSPSTVLGRTSHPGVETVRPYKCVINGGQRINSEVIIKVLCETHERLGLSRLY